MSASAMVFLVTIFCVPQLQYCQEDHVRMGHFGHLDTSGLRSELAKSGLSSKAQAAILSPLSEMGACQIASQLTRAEAMAGIAALGGKFISHNCVYESPSESYALIRHYDGHIERKVMPGLE